MGAKVYRDDLEIPADLSAEGRAAAEVILKFLQAQEIADTGGCKMFYSPAEWKARGEHYGLEAELIVCHDGGDHARAFSYDREDYKMVEALDAVLNKMGMRAGQCTGWYTAVYLNEPRPTPEQRALAVVTRLARMGKTGDAIDELIEEARAVVKARAKS